ncbi:MAG TPA: D-glycero-beta-D-manno-heptose-7-phosphate kinase [Candidatus Omnitrophota bacterium]|jgi:D-beta-D-heptose 7-phosphate kinase/D-beta-D-heptose 1-phosphate adenosyltransferase|nr:D-glycero-beta-D-manno-heptose-7-phosphate kinase [Candidatus Omnitrophota bacterium]HPN56118.1 D-glycero-beta-D-manno-heptose-7-phosphate kinase [Candidatus Omnitrophota bacterium]
MNSYKKIIKAFKSKKLLVIGDIILDQHIRGSVSRISPEAPVPVVVQEQDPTYSPGGAANVACNLRTLGAKVLLVGRIGGDPEGRLLDQCLQDCRIATSGVFVDRYTPTIVKTRIIAQHQQVLRLDRERVAPSEDKKFYPKVLNFLKRNIPKFDAMIMSDYGKGMITRELVEEICALARHYGKILTVDPKVEHFAYYSGVTAITPNRKEAENAIRNIKITHNGRKKLPLTSDRLETIADVEKAGAQLLKFMELESLLITLGEHGLMLFERGKKPVRIPTKAQDVFDVTGAGDTVISVYTLGLSAGVSKFQAADLANYAAGIVVGKMGAVTVTPEELLEATKNH